MTDRAARAARLDRALEEALDLDGEARAAYVEAAGDLRDELRELVRLHATMPRDFLARPAAECARPPEPPSLREGDRIGPYVLERQIGAGGSGTVWAARQSQPNRLVALKVLRAGLASESAVHRFRAEAEILGRLRHPAIAHVYEAGVHAGTPYIVMELVEGASPVTEHAAARGLGREARVRLVESACRALVHAHERGVVHRDVKPANLVADAEGRVRILDFGIASDGATGPGEISGTLAYMSPERAVAGHAADVRADVYGLGAVLLELLTGRPPVDVAGAPLDEALRRVREAPRPTARTDADLDAVVAKAIASDPGARYPTATALADDLARWLASEPVSARPPSGLHATRLFVRRRPALAAALGGIALALVGGAAASLRFAMRERDARADAERRAYLAAVTAAESALRVPDPAAARRELDRAPDSLRGFEWHHLRAALDDSVAATGLGGMTPVAGALRGDGRAIVVACGRYTPQGSVVRVDAATLGVIATTRTDGWPTCIGWARDDDVVAGFADGSIAILAPDGSIRGAVAAHEGVVNAVAWDAARGIVVSAGADGAVRAWDAATLAPRGTLGTLADRAVGVSIAPDGSRVAVAGRDGLIHVLATDGASPAATLAGHDSSVEDAQFSPDGTRIASCSRDGSVRLWDAASGRLVRAKTIHGENVRSARWSAAGTRLVTSSYDRTVTVRDASTLEEIARFRGHEAPVRWADFLPDGRVASCALDGVRVFDPRRVSAQQGFLPVREARAIAFAAAPDTSWGVVASSEGEVVAVDLTSGAELWRMRAGRYSYGVAVDGDGNAVAAWDNVVRIVSPRDGAIVRELPRGVANAPCVFPEEAATCVFASSMTAVTEIDLRTGATRRTWDYGDRAMSLAPDPAGAFVVAGGRSGSVAVLRRDTGATTEVARHATSVLAVAWDPQRGTIASADLSGVLRISRADGSGTILERTAHTFGVRALRYLPDGSRLVSGGTDDTLRLFDPDDLEETLSLRSGWPAAAISVTPDSRTISAVGALAVNGPWVRVWRSR